MLERGGSNPTEVVNRQYRTVAGDGIFTPGNSGEGISLNREVDFVAYYPYTTAMNGFLYPVNVGGTNQADPPAIDLMTTVERAPANQNTTDPVDLRFRHRLSGVILTVTPGANVQASELVGLRATITGQTVMGDYDVLNNTLSPSTGAGAVNQPIEFKMAANGQSGQALVLPAEEGGTGRRIEITLSGTSVSFPISISDGKKFESGFRYPFTITVNRRDDRIDVIGNFTGTIIEDWNTAPEELVEISLPSGTAPEGMVAISGGTFMMGSPASEPERNSDEVQHSVTVSSFYMGKYEVTQAEYQAVMGSNPSYFRGDRLPVEQVTWYDAINYCNALSQREGLTPAYTVSGTSVTWNHAANGYRLPTEAEWEYACRAGEGTPFNTGNNITTSQANYDGRVPYNGNPTGIYRGTTTDVGSFAPNAWGLHDMHGNVWEWCWDRYGSYTSGSQTNPEGAVGGAGRVLRGGSGWAAAGRAPWLSAGAPKFLAGLSGRAGPSGVSRPVSPPRRRPEGATSAAR
jgi:formylglycine-generating enzyme required for sulfatase activity